MAIDTPSFKLPDFEKPSFALSLEGLPDPGEQKMQLAQLSESDMMANMRGGHRTQHPGGPLGSHQFVHSIGRWRAGQALTEIDVRNLAHSTNADFVDKINQDAAIGPHLEYALAAPFVISKAGAKAYVLQQLGRRLGIYGKAFGMVSGIGLGIATGAFVAYETAELLENMDGFKVDAHLKDSWQSFLGATRNTKPDTAARSLADAQKGLSDDQFRVWAKDHSTWQLQDKLINGAEFSLPLAGAAAGLGWMKGLPGGKVALLGAAAAGLGWGIHTLWQKTDQDSKYSQLLGARNMESERGFIGPYAFSGRTHYFEERFDQLKNPKSIIPGSDQQDDPLSWVNKRYGEERNIMGVRDLVDTSKGFASRNWHKLTGTHPGESNEHEMYRLAMTKSLLSDDQYRQWAEKESQWKPKNSLIVSGIFAGVGLGGALFVAHELHLARPGTAMLALGTMGAAYGLSWVKERADETSWHAGLLAARLLSRPDEKPAI